MNLLKYLFSTCFAASLCDIKSLFRFAKNGIPQKTINPLLAMLNKNLNKLAKDKPIRRIVTFKPANKKTKL